MSKIDMSILLLLNFFVCITISQSVIGNKDECLWRDWIHYINNGCSAVYEDHGNCPVRFDCSTRSNRASSYDSSVVCEHEGKTYNGGELIPLAKHCLSCPCVEDFANSIGVNCHPLGCNVTEINEKSLLGCIPIYRDDICCPIDWQCPPNLNTTFRQGGRNTLPQNPPESQCFYGGQGYDKGFELLTGYLRCLQCNCSTPPLFTCKTPICPSPPDNNGEIRCSEVFSLNPGCCLQYDCWNINVNVDRVGRPLSVREKEICKANPCGFIEQCEVNYNECHHRECQRSCLTCATPLCDSHTHFVSPINECPSCEALKTPEEACEFDLKYCSGAECVVRDEENCRRGYCTPACVLHPATVEIFE